MENNAILTDLSLYGEEFTMGSGTTACLLIHGFGCGPIQMRELGERLSTWGFTARGILLPGHCARADGLALSSLHDWEGKVESEYLRLRSEYKEVVVIGFSLGALLALQMALKYPAEKIVLMSTPIFIVREYLPINGLIRVSKLFIKRVKTWKRRCSVESERYSGYVLQPIDNYYPLKVLLGIYQIIEKIKPRLKEIHLPALVIHSQKDLIAAPAGARYVMKHLGSDNKRFVLLNRSHHLVMFDVERGVVFSAIREFLQGNK